jgi:hypothetical protein
MSSRMAWRTAGKVGWGGGPLILFFPPCCCKAAMLEERDAERLGGLEVDDKVEFGRLLDRQIGRVGTLGNSIHKFGPHLAVWAIQELLSFTPVPESSEEPRLNRRTLPTPALPSKSLDCVFLALVISFPACH